MSAPFTIKFTDVWRDGKKSTRIESATLHGKPVVVIDPESLEQVARLNQAQDAEYARRGIDVEDCGGIDADVMQAALREFADPTPPIEEPTNLYAVVRDSGGHEWCHVGGHVWRSLTSTGSYVVEKHWHDADSPLAGDVVEIKSEGVVTP